MGEGLPRQTLPGWPRVLREELAAAYVGLSASTFRAEVMPQVPPVPLTQRRQGWDRLALDAWVDRRAGNVPPSASENDWDALLDDTGAQSLRPDLR